MVIDYYNFDFERDAALSPLPFKLLETDIDLYYDMALSLYFEIEKNNAVKRETVVILPVGPVFQYRRFVKLCEMRGLDLSGLHCFFMDEYLDEDKKLIDDQNPLSFRGFIRDELVEAMPPGMNLKRENIHFPDPDDCAGFDQSLEQLGNADICYAGVGITGHLAFNEPPEEEMSVGEFRNLPSRVVKLAPETLTINSNTAMRGAIEKVPRFAVTIGFKQILAASKLRIYFNRPWQSSVIRKLLFAPESSAFPATLVRTHPGASLILTREVAARPEFALK